MVTILPPNVPSYYLLLVRQIRHNLFHDYSRLLAPSISQLRKRGWVYYSVNIMAPQDDGYREIEQERRSSSQDEEKDALIADYPPRPRPYTRYLSFILSFLLTLSVFCNLMTLAANHNQDLDAVCSLHTSQSRECIVFICFPYALPVNPTSEPYM